MLCVALLQYTEALRTFHGNTFILLLTGVSIVYLLEIFAVVFPIAVTISCVYALEISYWIHISFKSRNVASPALHAVDTILIAKYCAQDIPLLPHTFICTSSIGIVCERFIYSFS